MGKAIKAIGNVFSPPVKTAAKVTAAAASGGEGAAKAAFKEDQMEKLQGATIVAAAAAPFALPALGLGAAATGGATTALAGASSGKLSDIVKIIPGADGVSQAIDNVNALPNLNPSKPVAPPLPTGTPSDAGKAPTSIAVPVLQPSSEKGMDLKIPVAILGAVVAVSILRKKR